MELIERTLDVSALLKQKSHFLFGPRSTGKSTLIRMQLPNAMVIDLLDPRRFNEFLLNPSMLLELDLSHHNLVVIDEIQRLPELLNSVHYLIEEKRLTFLLTGSSARKLKRGASNLLAGRAWSASLFPLTWKEIQNFDLLTYLNRGGLPQVLNSPFPIEELGAYVGNYLKEEIKAEALVQNMEQFSRFLEVAAICSAEEVNFTSIGEDCRVPPRTVQNFFGILEDTLTGFLLPPYRKTIKRKAVSRSKFYLFDVGVANYIAKRRQIEFGSEAFGKAFEHFVIQEVRAYLSYARKSEEMMYWRTRGFEIDLVLGDKLAVEIKSSTQVSDKHFYGLRAFAEERTGHRKLVVSLDRHRRTTTDGIEIYPWQDFLADMWSGRLLN